MNNGIKILQSYNFYLTGPVEHTGGRGGGQSHEQIFACLNFD